MTNMTTTTTIYNKPTSTVGVRNLPKVVGVMGAGPGCGKDTVARFMFDEAGYDIESFAAPIKNMTRTFLASLGYPLDEIAQMIQGTQKNKCIPELPGCVTPRYLMQTIGTEWGRECVSPTVWLDIMDYKIKGVHSTPGHGIVIPDVRFRNEVSFIREHKGAIVYVDGPINRTADHTDNNSDNVNMGHQSENDISMWDADVVVVNPENQTIEGLREETKGALDRLAAINTYGRSTAM